MVETLGDLPAHADRDPSDHYGHVDTRDQLARGVLQLPPRMRAVIVLRYFEDLSEAEVARILGCSVGSVKSQASRGLARLRTVLTADRAAVGGSATEREETRP